MNASLFQGISEMFSVLKMSSIKPEITSWYVKAFIKSLVAIGDCQVVGGVLSLGAVTIFCYIHKVVKVPM